MRKNNHCKKDMQQPKNNNNNAANTKLATDDNTSVINIPITNRGIKLQALVDFLDEKNYWENTTEEVVNIAKESTFFLSPLEFFFEEKIIQNAILNTRTNHNNDKKKQQYGDDNGGDILGVPDIYISHNWKNTTFGFLVASTLAFVGDLIHGHNEFDNKTTSNTNIAISTNFREMLEKRTGRDQDTNASPKKSFSGFGLERHVYVFIDMFCISHFQQGITHELSSISLEIIRKTKLLLIIIEDHHHNSKKPQTNNDIIDFINIRTLIDMFDTTLKLERLQEKDMERKKLDKIHGATLKSKRLKKSPWSKLICKSLPHNYIYCRFGTNHFNEYYNTVNLDIIMNLLNKSKIKKKSDFFSNINNNNKKKKATTSSFEDTYNEWINTKISSMTESKYFGSGIDALNRISSRFIRSLAKLELDENYEFNNDISNFEDVDPHLVKDKKSPSPKKNNNKKKAMKRK